MAEGSKLAAKRTVKRKQTVDIIMVEEFSGNERQRLDEGSMGQLVSNKVR